MSECDKYGFEDPYCNCYLHEIEERVTFLEEELDKITNVLMKISNVVLWKENERSE